MQKLAQSGFPLYPDKELENYIREGLGTFMPKSEEERNQSLQPVVDTKFVDETPKTVK